MAATCEKLHDIEIFEVEKGCTDEIRVYNNILVGDIVIASLTNWSANSPKTIAIKSSTREREFIGANFCDEMNILEIHCFVKQGQVNPNAGTQDAVFVLDDFKTYCFRVMLLEHDTKVYTKCLKN